MSVLRVGLLGLGVVGAGTWQVLTENAREIARRAGREIQITAIAVRDLEKARGVVGDRVRLTTDGAALVRSGDVDLVVELMGGQGAARDWILEAIHHGKHVVTANKALLATHGNEIFAAAHERRVMVGFEAAVAGGIPIIKALREGLTANHIQWVAGIINGTTNYILTEMRARGLAFDKALDEAQRLGYAEADPTFDIQGVDAAHKLTLLASLAFGVPIQFDRAHIEGITHLAQEDIAHAERLGYRIKLLGITRKRPEGIELRVHPTLIPAERLLANVEGAMNAVQVNGDCVGPTLYYGQGAGALPTASAVVADIIDVARLRSAEPAHWVPHLAFQSEAMSDLPILPMSEVVSSYYLRLRVRDCPGVLADLARVLADCGISVGSMIQQPHGTQEADIIFLTHQAREGDIDHAMERIQQLPFVMSPVTRLRVESLL